MKYWREKHFLNVLDWYLAYEIPLSEREAVLKADRIE